MTPHVLSADSLGGNKVVNRDGEDLGKIEELMINVGDGRVQYAVLSFGGFLGMGDKMFAIPWESLALDSENKRFYLNIDKDRLKDAPGFDKSHWPNMADARFQSSISSYYNR